MPTSCLLLTLHFPRKKGGYKISKCIWTHYQISQSTLKLLFFTNRMFQNKFSLFTKIKLLINTFSIKITLYILSIKGHSIGSANNIILVYSTLINHISIRKRERACNGYKLVPVNHIVQHKWIYEHTVSYNLQMYIALSNKRAQCKIVINIFKWVWVY